MSATITELSVRAVCEFLLRSGSLDNRYGGADRMLEGARIHRRLQKQEGERYRPEVTLRGEFERGGVFYRVQGRADGVLEEEGRAVIDEIKTTARPLEDIPGDGERAHWGQAMCYAYLYAVSFESGDRPAMAVRLRYVQADTLEIREIGRDCPFEELERFFFGLLDQYRRWAELQADWAAARDGSIRAQPFPFEGYRPGQRPFAAAVYNTITARGRLFCQAPTGIGKTISTLFPAVKAMGEGLAEKIFYLTAKTVTRRVAEDALERMRAGGLRLRSVTLTAKDKICPRPERECNPERCPFADGYYDRVNDCIFALLQSPGDAFTREAIEACAQQWRVCPFELTLDLSVWCDAVIGDYNHLFDPVASLKRYFSEGGEYVFLIDEAHNLVDRAREMYSASLDKSAVLALRRRAREAGEADLARALGKLNTALLALAKRCAEEGTRKERAHTLILGEPPQEIVTAARQYAAFCDEWLERRRDSPVRPQALELYFSVSFFVRIAEGYDEHYATLAVASPGALLLRLVCLDASAFLDKCMALGRASVLFSATFSPFGYFLSVLGGGEGAKRLALPSPFDPGRLCLSVADRVSTRYSDRESSRPQVAALLHAFAAARAGHYLFFFPSYTYMRAVYEEYAAQFPGERTLLQSAAPEEREAFLSQFDNEQGDALAGFCVLGGVFAEGLDLRGERLIGAAVVGVGLPQIGDEQDLLRDYYERSQGSGFDFAYRFPGMNKVLQAAGRVIRGENDRGAVLLVDSRFSSPAYRALFPAHWEGAARVRDEDELAARLGAFWSSEF